MPPLPLNAAIELTLTMRPPGRRRYGRTAHAIRKLPFRFAPTTSSQTRSARSSGAPSSMPPVPPALLTSTSMVGPTSAVTQSRAACTSSRRLTSACRQRIRSSRAVCSSTSARRPRITTWSPRSARAAAIARPMPVPPPVTTATRVSMEPDGSALRLPGLERGESLLDRGQPAEDGADAAGRVGPEQLGDGLAARVEPRSQQVGVRVPQPERRAHLLPDGCLQVPLSGHAEPVSSRAVGRRLGIPQRCAVSHEAGIPWLAEHRVARPLSRRAPRMEERSAGPVRNPVAARGPGVAENGAPRAVDHDLPASPHDCRVERPEVACVHSGLVVQRDAHALRHAVSGHPGDDGPCVRRRLASPRAGEDRNAPAGRLGSPLRIRPHVRRIAADVPGDGLPRGRRGRGIRRVVHASHGFSWRDSNSGRLWSHPNESEDPNLTVKSTPRLINDTTVCELNVGSLLHRRFGDKLTGRESAEGAGSDLVGARSASSRPCTPPSSGSPPSRRHADHLPSTREWAGRLRAEAWPSGRRHTPGKRVGGQPPRGFEPLSLRRSAGQPPVTPPELAAGAVGRIAWRRTVLGGELAVPCTRNPLQRG